mmetsp:Transcript_17384/g.27187  ORF Transcript_17384/g.27187 Transcript_17384/m.27187 type:complete len:337 (-) Transcript_17384:154-1164(-)|eukprot:CAMPEP_0202685492 /NCGR_PEP_ID=MMETSP1385-20130828/1275_1 /ASSEMBLY_ACC=CAM_ASM_000861 /TAXON_ID=933848 /ORGANISM="Elphidium margaritaceum" /LENGTH=336 /DNA_ID=CAMNT_0049339853 /DNA_START=55 /DNA_END=1065 /DNA_ORIENTATION=+
MSLTTPSVSRKRPSLQSIVSADPDGNIAYTKNRKRFKQNPALEEKKECSVPASAKKQRNSVSARVSFISRLHVDPRREEPFNWHIKYANGFEAATVQVHNLIGCGNLALTETPKYAGTVRGKVDFRRGLELSCELNNTFDLFADIKQQGKEHPAYQKYMKYLKKAQISAEDKKFLHRASKLLLKVIQGELPVSEGEDGKPKFFSVDLLRSRLKSEYTRIYNDDGNDVELNDDDGNELDPWFPAILSKEKYKECVKNIGELTKSKDKKVIKKEKNAKFPSVNDISDSDEDEDDDVVQGKKKKKVAHQNDVNDADGGDADGGDGNCDDHVPLIDLNSK